MFVHDWAGWWMMILAIVLIWGEMSLLSALIIESPIEGPLAFGGGRAVAAAQSPSGLGLGRSRRWAPGPKSPWARSPRSREVRRRHERRGRGRDAWATEFAGSVPVRRDSEVR